MDTRRAGPRALGWYRAPWHALIAPVLVAAVLLMIGLLTRGRDGWPIAFGLILLTLALSPVTVIRPTGIVIPLRFLRLRWTQIVAIQEIDLPGSRECLRAKRSDGRVFVLRGVPADRLPGLIALAENAHRAPSP